MPRVLLVVLAVLCTLSSAAAAGSRSEGEYRNYLNVSGAAQRVKLGLTAETRSEGKIDDLRYLSVAVGGGVGLGRNLAVGGYYSRIDTRSGDEWSVEHRPYVDVTLRAKWSGAEISDRNRAELRIRDGESSWRYRNRARLSIPIGTTPLAASLDGEVFVALEDAEVGTTRMTAGVDAKVAKATKLGLVYVYETRLKSGNWTSAHALGLRVSFDVRTGR